MFIIAKNLKKVNLMLLNFKRTNNYVIKVYFFNRTGIKIEIKFKYHKMNLNYLKKLFKFNIFFMFRFSIQILELDSFKIISNS